MTPNETNQPSLTLLIKLLKMTTSSSDAEALVAARKANAELKKFGGDWESLLRGKVTVIGDPFADLTKPDVGLTRAPRPATAPRAPAPQPPPTPQPRPARPPTFACVQCGLGALPFSGAVCNACANLNRRRTQPKPKPQPQPQPTKPPAWSNAPKNINLEELI